MKRILIGVILAAGCGPAPRAAAPAGHADQALEAMGQGDLDGAEAALANRNDYLSRHMRARIMLLRNRNREAQAILTSLLREKIKNAEEEELQQHVFADLATASVRLDDFLQASSVYAMMGEAILAQKYKALSRTVPYATDGAWEETSIDFHVTDPLPVVPVTVNGRPAMFMIETAIDEIVLEREFAKRAGVESAGLRGADEFKRTFDEATVQSVTLNRVTVRNVPVHIGKMPTVGTVRVDGALGLGFLMHYDFTLDYRRGRLTLRRAGGKIAGGVQACFAGDRYLVIPGKMNGTIPTYVGVGTGLPGTVLAVAESVLHSGEEVREVTVGGLRLVKPSLDRLSFPSGLEHSFGIPVGFMLGHQALRGRVLRLEPRSMRLLLE